MPSIEMQDIPDILDRFKEMWKDLENNFLIKESEEIRIRMGYSIYPGDGEQMESLIHVAQARKENLWKDASSVEESCLSSNLLVFKQK